MWLVASLDAMLSSTGSSRSLDKYLFLYLLKIFKWWKPIVKQPPLVITVYESTHIQAIFSMIKVSLVFSVHVRTKTAHHYSWVTVA